MHNYSSCFSQEIAIYGVNDSKKKMKLTCRCHTRKRGAGEETVNDQGVGGEREEQSGEQVR